MIEISLKSKFELTSAGSIHFGLFGSHILIHWIGFLADINAVDASNHTYLSIFSCHSCLLHIFHANKSDFQFLGSKNVETLLQLMFEGEIDPTDDGAEFDELQEEQQHSSTFDGVIWLCNMANWFLVLPQSCAIYWKNKTDNIQSLLWTIFERASPCTDIILHCFNVHLK